MAARSGRRNRATHHAFFNARVVFHFRPRVVDTTERSCPRLAISFDGGGLELCEHTFCGFFPWLAVLAGLSGVAGGSHAGPRHSLHRLVLDLHRFSRRRSPSEPSAVTLEFDSPVDPAASLTFAFHAKAGTGRAEYIGKGVCPLRGDSVDGGATAPLGPSASGRVRATFPVGICRTGSNSDGDVHQPR